MQSRFFVLAFVVALLAGGCHVHPDRGIQFLDSLILVIGQLLGLILAFANFVWKVTELLLVIPLSLFSQELRYANKVVVITGASSGLGADVAIAAATQGASLLLAARRLDKLKEMQAVCRKAGAKEVEFVVMDTSAELDHSKLIDTVSHIFGRMDLLVLNAGIPGPWTRFDNLTDLKMLERVMDVNFWGYVKTTRLALPMLKQSRGHIVVVSSMYGHFAAPFQAGYCASKHALTGFFDSLRQELAGQVGVTIHSPGGVATEVQSRFQTSQGHDAVLTMPSSFLASSPACARSILHAYDTRTSQAFYPPLASLLFQSKLTFGEWFDAAYFRMVDVYSRAGVMTLTSEYR